MIPQKGLKTKSGAAHNVNQNQVFSALLRRLGRCRKRLLPTSIFCFAMSHRRTSDPRRQVRLEVTSPVRVQMRETLADEWTELTHFINASQIGARFRLNRPLEAGRLVLLTSALPSQLRCYAFDEPQYRIWAVVTNVDFLSAPAAEEILVEVGVAFLGARPPADYAAHPARRYEIADAPTPKSLWTVWEKSSNHERGNGFNHNETRHPIALEIELQTFAVKAQSAQTELTVTENVSSHGAAVYTTLNLAPGRFLRVTHRANNVALLAVVRAQHHSNDGRTRLHLEFLNDTWPLLDA